MKLADVKTALSQHSDLNVRFELPDGKMIPARAHITEVARVEKQFLDCGGTLRNEAICRLQLWVAKDFWHRLKAGKLLSILNAAGEVVRSDDLEVDIEYELGVITQSPVSDAVVVVGELVFKLAERRTACLAKEK